MTDQLRRVAQAAGLAMLALAGAATAQTTGKNPSHEDILRGFDIAALLCRCQPGNHRFRQRRHHDRAQAAFDHELLHDTHRFRPDQADIVLLQTLYDRRMKMGLPRLAAIILADSLIEEKRRSINPSAPPRTEAGPVLRDIVASLEKDAEAGSARAMLHLAEAYRAGTGLPIDPQMSQLWLKRATSHPDPARRFDAAYALQFGRIVLANQPEAALIYDGIARHGLNTAQNNLGHMLRNGHGVEADKVEALKWFLISANAGNALATKNRDSLSAELDDDGRQEAQRRAAAWKPVTEAAR